jgi:hypothetical protein
LKGGVFDPASNKKDDAPGRRYAHRLSLGVNPFILNIGFSCTDFTEFNGKSGALVQTAHA